MRGSKSKKNNLSIFLILIRDLSHKKRMTILRPFLEILKRLITVGAELVFILNVTSYLARHYFMAIQKNNGAPLK